MKNIITTSIFFLLVTFAMHAQVDRSSFKVGLNAGIPVGDAADVSSFSIGLDVNYHWGVSELFDVGLATGFINAFGDTDTSSVGPVTVQTEFEDFQFLPVAASVRIYPTYHFKFGVDAGYAVGISDGMEGGLYYRPIVGYNITGNTELNVSYMVVEDNISFSVATVGILFLF
ncbi:hypothetical protein [Flagellimonas pacifica]|uniref:Outer membrane protein beta-barrel domain-containing protein n=1 Tax=Flagellimonas pacifica TaxID=1247520 RepID=A0A285MQK1_9FLAO|nr:hypothetical protein [Allomuricauda parva]SNY99418.1 hypothetical protein SAMN06265377_1224 [Allomuricauda parva]